MHVIGICGPSCSGKSTIAEQLAHVLDGQHIDADLTYILGSERALFVGEDGNTYESFDRPELYDLDRIANVLESVRDHRCGRIRLLDWDSKEHYTVELTDKRPIIIEGFAIYTHDRLASLLDSRYFLDLSVEESINRRIARGGRKSDASYAQIAHAERRWIEGQADRATIVLDGTKPLDSLIRTIFEHEL